MSLKTGHNPLAAEERARKLKRAVNAYDAGHLGLWQAATEFHVDQEALREEVRKAYAAGEISRAPPAPRRSVRVAQ